MQLTKHFSLEELTASTTARLRNIKNTPTDEQVENLRALCQQVLEPLRIAMNEPIMINSGFRCGTLNALVGGVYNSNHLYGYAADIRIKNEKQGLKYFRWIRENCIVDELLFEKSGGTKWLHVSYRRDKENRHKTNANYRV